MSRFPDEPSPNTPYAWQTVLPLARGGWPWAQKTRQLTRAPLLRVDLSYTALTWDKVAILHDFWTYNLNGTFAFVDFNGYSKYGASPGVLWKALYVGKGTGSQTTWTMPTFDVRLDGNFAVWVGGTPQTITFASSDPGAGDGWVHTGAGSDGLDQLNFRSGHEPASNAIIMLDATCRRAMPMARFLSDEFPFNTRNPGNYQGGTLQIIETRVPDTYWNSLSNVAGTGGVGSVTV